MNTPSNARPIVEVRGLVKVFCDFWGRPKVRAVDGIDFVIQPGEIFGLLGPNGSGKSTTLKMLLDLLHPTAGEVRVLGEPPNRVPVKRSIGFLPEASYMYPYLSPRETLTFYAKLFGLNRSQRRERIDQLLDMIGLAHAANRPVGEFSKGMARRVGLAQALINDPRLVILDEPTSGLDPIGCRQVKDLMLALAKRGKTVILSSHLLADVEDVCDHIAILYNGKIRARGHIRALLEKTDRLNLTIPTLPPAQIKAVLALLRERVGVEPDVEHPSMGLEQYFLGVIEHAHEKGEISSGVLQRKGIAEYLSPSGTSRQQREDRGRLDNG